MNAIDRMILAEWIDRDPTLMDSANVRDAVRMWPKHEFDRVWNSYVCAMVGVNPTADARNAAQRKEALV